jgi:hypothetical protein
VNELRDDLLAVELEEVDGMMVVVVVVAAMLGELLMRWWCNTNLRQTRVQ